MHSDFARGGGGGLCWWLRGRDRGGGEGEVSCPNAVNAAVLAVPVAAVAGGGGGKENPRTSLAAVWLLISAA